MTTKNMKRWAVTTKKGKTVKKFKTRDEARGFKLSSERIFDTYTATYIR